MQDGPYIGYLRISTTEQADGGAGLDAQRTAIAGEADRRGWEIRFVEDAGFSGRSRGRPGLTEALEALRGGEAAGLIVSKIDRLSRSLIDFATLMAEAQRQGWALVALDAPVDLSTPTGEAMASIVATFSQLERRLIGQRTREALAVKRGQGVRLGRPPAIKPEIANRIRQARASGATLREIAERLNRDGVPTPRGGTQWRPSSFGRIL